jgi:hypothetical protein
MGKNIKMLIPIFQILYSLAFFAMFLMSIFVVFHIIFYSYSTVSRLVTLAIFIPVVGVLLFTNLVLFRALDLGQLFSGMLT